MRTFRCDGRQGQAAYDQRGAAGDEEKFDLAAEGDIVRSNETVSMILSKGDDEHSL